MNLIIILPIIAALAFLLTAILRRYALANSVIDVPNDRSSHSMPTPRGGGVSIVISFLLAILLLGFLGVADWTFVIALFGAGLGIATIGFLDDHGHIAARWRLLGHFAAASWILYWLGGFPPLPLLGTTLDMGWFGHILAAIYLVWMLNLYNFMDGIDGIAGIEAITVCLGGVLLLFCLGKGLDNEGIWVLAVLASAVLGFLIWNFPPAKIFMGDAGSGFLGVVLGALSVKAAWVAPELFWSWLILLGIFVVDATFTLLRRLLRGDRIYEAHWSHAYQYASRYFGKHLPVTLGVFFINVLWLFPFALAVGLGMVDALLGVFVAYLPLILIAVRFRAGSLETV
ncbi:TPA: glycosyltransferase family 4 protein [Pseudomonas aeruginosa]